MFKNTPSNHKNKFIIYIIEINFHQNNIEVEVWKQLNFNRKISHKSLNSKKIILEIYSWIMQIFRINLNF